MSEFGQSLVRRGYNAATRALSAMVLAPMAEGVVASTMPRRLPDAHYEALGNVGTLVPLVATDANALVAETLVDYPPALADPIIYV